MWLDLFLVHVGVKVDPILEMDLHCWIHDGISYQIPNQTNQSQRDRERELVSHVLLNPCCVTVSLVGIKEVPLCWDKRQSYTTVLCCYNYSLQHGLQQREGGRVQE